MSEKPTWSITRGTFHRFKVYPLIVTGCAPLVLLSPVWLTGKALFWGTPALQFVPWWYIAWENLRSGYLPLWNPLVGMGAPLLANYQSALLYPPTWLYFLLAELGERFSSDPLSTLAWGQALLAALHLGWAGMGMACVARKLGLSELAQTISGLAFGLCGYLVARGSFLSILSAAAWTPWILWALTPDMEESAIGRSFPAHCPLSPVHCLLSPAYCPLSTVHCLLTTAYCPLSPVPCLCLFLAMQLLAGHAQTTWYTWLLAAMWCGFWGFCGSYSREVPDSLQHRLHGLICAWAVLAVALITALGLTAIQLLPTGEYLLQSQRSASVDFDLAMTYSFWPWRLLTAFAPNFFGSPATGDFWGYATYWEDALYIGVLPILLALVTSIRGVGAGLTTTFHRQLHHPDPPLLRTTTFHRQSHHPGPPLLRTTTFHRQLHHPDPPLLRTAAIHRQSHHPGPPLPLPMVKLVRFLTGAGCLSILLALGKNTPVFPWLYAHILTFSMFQAPARYLLWLEVCLALLAGIGVQGWRRPTGRALYWTRLATAGAVAISIGAGLAWYFLRQVNPTFIQATAILGFLAAGTGAFCLIAPTDNADKEYPVNGESFDSKSSQSWLKSGKSWSKSSQSWLKSWWQIGVVSFVLFDLLYFGWSLNPGIGLDFYQNHPGTAQEVKSLSAGGRLMIPEGDEEAIKFKRFLRFKTFDPGEDWNRLRQSLIPNLAMLEHIPSANNFDPMVPGRYARWMSQVGAGLTDTIHQQSQYPDPPLRDEERRLAFYRMMGVGVVESNDATAPDGVTFSPLEGGWRVRWVACAESANDGDMAWNKVMESGFTPESEVVVESSTVIHDCQDNMSARSNSQGTAQITMENPNRLVVSVQANAPGYVVVSDVWYPGWRVTVNEQETEILRANYLFRAVAVPAGESQVIFSYEPISFSLGAVISLLTLIVVLLLMYRQR